MSAALIGFGASDSIVTSYAKRKQGAAERRQNGYAGKFAIVDEEKWEQFKESLRT